MGTIHHILEQRDRLPVRLMTARELAEERRRRPEEKCFGTASEALDRLLAGGLLRGATTELVGGRSSGRFALVTSILAAVTGAGEAAALVDLGDGFDPQRAAAAGVELERLLWVRPRRMKDVFASAEVILTTGMPLVVVDLGLPPVAGGRGGEASWMRLARAARVQRTAFFVSSPYRVSGTAAQVVLEARRSEVRWRGRRAQPRLLAGLGTELELKKSRPEARRTGRNPGRGILGWWAGEVVERSGPWGRGGPREEAWDPAPERAIA